MKDIDRLKKRNRARRDLMERAGSTGLALSGLIGLLFLTVLVWQIAKPTFIDGESGQIEPASEFIPVSDYILKWDHPTVDDNGDLIGDATYLHKGARDEAFAFDRTASRISRKCSPVTRGSLPLRSRRTT